MLTFRCNGEEWSIEGSRVLLEEIAPSGRQLSLVSELNDDIEPLEK